MQSNRPYLDPKYFEMQLTFLILFSCQIKITTGDTTLLGLELYKNPGISCEGGRLISSKVCLPQTYLKSDMPSKPLLVNTSLVIANKNGIREVDDKKMTVTIDLHIMLYWYDNRIIANFSKEEE